jgi:hypothetical protein
LKTIDPFAGFRLTYGNSLIHLAYFIALFLIKEEPECKQANYKGAKIALLVSHILIVVFQNVGFLCTSCFGLDLIPKVIDTLCLILYHAVIFYT